MSDLEQRIDELEEKFDDERTLTTEMFEQQAKTISLLITRMEELEESYRNIPQTVKPVNIPTGYRVNCSLEGLTTFIRCLIDKRKIEAIKEVRSMTGMSLKDAKDFVEGIHGIW